MKKRFISALLGAVLALGAFSPSAGQLFGAANTAYAAEALSVTSDFKSGVYNVNNKLPVTFSAADKSAKLYYNTNGGKFHEYTGTVNIVKNTEVQVYAEKNGVKSPTVTYSYNLRPNVIFHTKDNSDGTKTVTLNCAMSGVSVYYTLDGSTPTTSSALYANKPITISRTTLIKAIAVKAGWNTGSVLKRFEIAGTVQDDVPTQPTQPTKPVDTKPETPTSVSILDDYTQKWGYNQLNSTQKKAYARIYDLAKNVGSEVSLADLSISPDELDKIYWAFDYDNPQFLELGSGYGYSYYPSQKTKVIEANIQYGRTKNETAKIKSSFLNTADKIISEASKKTSDYEKLLYIHDWIVNNTYYNANGPAYKSEADGPIAYGEALCEGYSKAFMYLAQSLGFQCICVVGKANGGGHMWNMVKMGNDWYHVDTTFDDPVMVGGGSVCRHDYFLVSTSTIRYDHQIDNPVAIPSSTKDY